jgi:hypothetical protein
MTTMLSSRFVGSRIQKVEALTPFIKSTAFRSPTKSRMITTARFLTSPTRPKRQCPHDLQLPQGTTLFYSNKIPQSSDDRNRSDDENDGGTGLPSHSHSLQDGRLKRLLNDSTQPVTGVVTGQYRDTDHVEILGLLRYDFVWIDCEHSSGTPDHVLNLIIAAERRNLPSLVRMGYGYQNIIGYVFMKKKKPTLTKPSPPHLPSPFCSFPTYVDTHRSIWWRVLKVYYYPNVNRRGMCKRW